MVREDSESNTCVHGAVSMVGDDCMSEPGSIEVCVCVCVCVWEGVVQVFIFIFCRPDPLLKVPDPF